MKHLGEDTLLLLDEGELPEREARAAEAHLEACEPCRERKARLQSANRVLQVLHHEEDPGADSHALRSSIAVAMNGEVQAATAKNSAWGWWMPVGMMRIAVPLVLLLLLCFGTVRRFLRAPAARQADLMQAGPEPDRSLTPGAANAVALSDLCALSDDDLDPKLPADKERAVFHAYGVDERAAHMYQVDYLINPQLGGNDSLQNLWPEPNNAAIWNAEAKDALETRLHGMVCSGQVDLKSAQRDMAADWIGAYKKYMHLNRPPVTEEALASELEWNLP
jgi:hypothetical protein